MKKHLQKLDTVGLVLLVVAALWYPRVSEAREKWILALAILGGILVVIGLPRSTGRSSPLSEALDKIRDQLRDFSDPCYCVVVGFNYIGQRHPKRFDTTASKRYSLAPQTVQVLTKLDKDLDIKAYYPGRTIPAERAARRIQDRKLAGSL